MNKIIVEIESDEFLNARSIWGMIVHGLNESVPHKENVVKVTEHKCDNTKYEKALRKAADYVCQISLSRPIRTFCRETREALKQERRELIKKWMEE